MDRSGERYVKLYHGYGHTHNLLVYGHTFAGKAPVRKKFTNNRLRNMVRLVRLFFLKPLPGVDTELHWNDQRIPARSEFDGFLKFEWKSELPVTAGWHQLTVSTETKQGRVTGRGELFVPHITQYAFISDIDDTIMISYSATILRRMKELFSSSPLKRKLFPSVAEHYKLLSVSNTKDGEPNPFFYVSSSEWNLYDYLKDVFRNGRLPEGAFLLSQVKQWYELVKTGKTRHRGKLLRVMRIIDAFPNQQFILMGDNTQSDPPIYAEIANKYPGRVFAIYIRNVHRPNESVTDEILNTLHRSTGIHTCQFSDSRAAMEHSRKIGLINV